MSANGCTASARAAQSMPGTRGFKPITHYHSQKSRKKPGLLLATTNPDSYFTGLGQLPLAGLEGPDPSPGRLRTRCEPMRRRWELRFGAPDICLRTARPMRTGCSLHPTNNKHGSKPTTHCHPEHKLKKRG